MRGHENEQASCLHLATHEWKALLRMVYVHQLQCHPEPMLQLLLAANSTMRAGQFLVHSIAAESLQELSGLSFEPAAWSLAYLVDPTCS